MDGQHGFLTDDMYNFSMTSATTTGTPTITTTGANTAHITTTTTAGNQSTAPSTYTTTTDSAQDEGELGFSITDFS